MLGESVLLKGLGAWVQSIGKLGTPAISAGLVWSHKGLGVAVELALAWCWLFGPHGPFLPQWCCLGVALGACRVAEGPLWPG